VANQGRRATTSAPFRLKARIHVAEPWLAGAVLTVDEFAGWGEIVIADPGGSTPSVMVAALRSAASGLDIATTGNLLATEILEQKIEVQCADMASSDQQHS